MKKFTGVMMALLLVIGFTMAATAAEMDVTCENCPKAYDPGIIPIGTVTSTQYATSSSCAPFDYETGSGYCEAYDHNNRIIFTLCDCTRGTFNEDDQIPLRMSISPNTEGVYFNWEAPVSVNAIATNLRYMVDSADCPSDFPPVGGSIRTTDVTYTFTLENGTMYQTQIDALGNLVALDAYGTPIAGAPQGVSLELDTDGTIAGSWCGSSTCSQAEFYNTVSGSNTCSLTSDQRITSITVNNVYTITADDVYNNLQKFQINLPSLRYDLNEIIPGDSVTVVIEYGRVVNCGPCFACECERTIGVLGACGSSDTDCMYFPFVFVDMAPWDTGIVITNLSTAYGTLSSISRQTAIADMSATFTYTDNTGAEFTYTKQDFDSTVWAFMMNAFAVNLSGTPASGNGWLLVQTNFAVDGYQFVTNGSFGGSTQARGCCDYGLCGN